MTQGRLPYFQFFPSDWLGDAKLKRCSHAVKGVWIDTLCLMFDCEPRGVLMTAGRPWSDKELAAALGGQVDAAMASISELLKLGVLKRLPSGALYSSRMVRDAELRLKRQNAGKMGGNPVLVKQVVKQVVKDKDNLSMEYGIGNGTEVEKNIFEIPEVLKTREFMCSWERWKTHRRAFKKPKDWAIMFHEQLVWLSKFGAKSATEIVNASLRNGWQGLFEPRTETKTNGIQQKTLKDKLFEEMNNRDAYL